MIEKIKDKITLENFLCLFVCICPILDIMSFLFRNYFNTNWSPTTIIRPIIPCFVFVVLFFKETNKKQKIFVASIYAVYSVIHLIIFKKLHNDSSYGNLINEMQYIVNYSLMIINLYLFYTVIHNKTKLKNSVTISLTIYIVSLLVSIITKTSSSTYIEKIGYKGYFESGNSLCTVLILSICIILPNIKNKDYFKVLIVLLTGVYLISLSGMRTGLFGFSLIIGIFILAKILINLKNKKINKKQIILIILGIIITAVFILLIGSKTLERRKMLKQNEINNIDTQTMEKRYVTGDILEIYKKIKTNSLPENYMNEAEKRAIIQLCEYSKKINLSNVNLRAQQFIYNVFLVKEQKNILYILFGNGYKNQTGELVMEMEIPALLFNFGLLGLALYFGPFVLILVRKIKNSVNNLQYLDIENTMYLAGSGLAISLSCLSGYVFFNFSSMTMTIILITLLESKDNVKKE